MALHESIQALEFVSTLLPMLALAMRHRKVVPSLTRKKFPIRKHGRDDPTPTEVLAEVFPTDKRYGSKQKNTQDSGILHPTPKKQ